MSTINTLADEVIRRLSGFTLRQDRQTHLDVACTDTDLALTLGSALNVSTGVIQIEDELIYIDSFDRTTGSVTVAPYGRGYNGTTAVAHNVNSRVIISPSYPYVDVKTAINETLYDVFPELYGVAKTTITYQPYRTAYALPTDVWRVITVAYQAIGPSKEWVPVRGWRTDSAADVTSFGTSNTLMLYSAIPPGRKVQVVYSTQPTQLTATSTSTSSFSTLTGLPETCRDVIILGAASRLSSFIDPGRLNFSTAEADQQSQVAARTYGAGIQSAKYLNDLYEKRKKEEADKLDNLYGIRLHFTR